MNITVIGATKSHLDEKNVSISNENMPTIVEELKRFAGAEAGICYMSKPYFDSYVSDKEKALKRFETVAPTGHHSIAGHGQVNLLLDGIPKILAMYLNNLSAYETSEKSGRYTVMTGNSEKEKAVYDKWCDKLIQIIKEKYGDKIDDRTVDKLAKENARYMLSVFTPTTMGYTASIRQLNYIVCWCERFANNTELPNNYFYNTLKEHFVEFGKQLKSLIYVPELEDHKNRFGFDMIEPKEIGVVKEQYGRCYTVGYSATFAEYAQAQRHRTLKYSFEFDGVSKEFYVPPIVKDMGYESEWLEDIKSVAEYIPNGTLVFIKESGKVEDFYLKAMERNCGRAQLEIMQNNLEIMQKLWDNRFEMSENTRAYMEKFYINEKPKMKGQCLVCKEPCVWGCKEAQNRLI